MAAKNYYYKKESYGEYIRRMAESQEGTGLDLEGDPTSPPARPPSPGMLAAKERQSLEDEKRQALHDEFWHRQEFFNIEASNAMGRWPLEWLSNEPPEKNRSLDDLYNLLDSMPSPGSTELDGIHQKTVLDDLLESAPTSPEASTPEGPAGAPQAPATPEDFSLPADVEEDVELRDTGKRHQRTLDDSLELEGGTERYPHEQESMVYGDSNVPSWSDITDLITGGERQGGRDTPDTAASGEDRIMEAIRDLQRDVQEIKEILSKGPEKEGGLHEDGTFTPTLAQPTKRRQRAGPEHATMSVNRILQPLRG